VVGDVFGPFQKKKAKKTKKHEATKSKLFVSYSS